MTSRHSSDDLLLKSTTTTFRNTRPRSTSPSKRYSLPASFHESKKLPTIPTTDDLSLDSSDQWKDLIKSPIAKTLHINDVGESPKYNIPIPFQLNLPPKLSAQNVQNFPKSPTLVYNGSGYEKLNNTCPESPTPKRKSIPVPRRPAPPPVAMNKAKSPKPVHIERMLHADELSIIEETQSEYSTRNSSVMNKNTNQVNPRLDGYDNKVNRKIDFNYIGEPKLKKIDFKFIGEPNKTDLVVEADSNPDYSGSFYQSSYKKPEESIKPLKLNYTNENLPPLPLTAKLDIINGKLKHLENENNKILQKSSPTRRKPPSDDIEIRTQLSHIIPNIQNNLNDESMDDNIENQRALSNVSRNSMNSEASWNSLQKSINITLGQDDAHDISNITSVVDSTSNQEDGNDWENEVDKSGSEKSAEMMRPLTINRKADQVSKDTTHEDNYFEDSVITAYLVDADDSSYASDTRCDGEIKHSDNKANAVHKTEASNNYIATNKPLDMQEEVFIKLNPMDFESLAIKPNEREIPDTDNCGAGKSFHFPNNSSNITNSPEMKLRSRDSIRSKVSRLSYQSPNGQIEIPDLNEKSIAGSYTTKTSCSSYNSTPFDDVRSESSISTANEFEPIGFLSKGAQKVMNEHLNGFSDDSNSDSNDDSDFTNSKNKIRSKSVPDLQFEKSKPLLVPSPTRSPARHSRHKSMHSIDLNSVMQNNDHSSLPLNLKVQSHNKDYPKLVVTPPPVQVNYAVDFVEAAPIPQINPINKTDELMSNLSRKLQKSSISHNSNVSPKKLNRNKSNSTRSKFKSTEDDVDSVVIDLTKDKYDVTTIHRSNSTHSYKSVVEKIDNGKEVEVVLLEDDADLASIYSKYRSMQLLRSNSTQSSLASNSSSQYSVASSKQLALKPIIKNRNMNAPPNMLQKNERMKYSNSVSSMTSSTSSSYDCRRIQPPSLNERFSPQKPLRPNHHKRHTIDFDSSHFDYATNGNYDFQSYKTQLNASPTNHHSRKSIN